MANWLAEPSLTYGKLFTYHMVSVSQFIKKLSAFIIKPLNYTSDIEPYQNRKHDQPQRQIDCLQMQNWHQQLITKSHQTEADCFRCDMSSTNIIIQVFFVNIAVPNTTTLNRFTLTHCSLACQDI